MCGIVGLINREYTDKYFLNNTLKNMTDKIIHRGPDDSGIWTNEEFGIGFGHRRLSILDLSQEGHQPKASESGRFYVVFNGEIYNFIELRKELEELGCKFIGHSDTEVLLHSIEQWGLEKAVSRFAGMFAFALWDKYNKTVSLVRDRIGEKPLYYGWIGRTFLFASELKAIRAYSKFNNEIDRNSLALYIRHNYIPSPYTIYKNIYKLVPGTILTMDLANNNSIEEKVYWSAKEKAEIGKEKVFSGSREEATEKLDNLIRESIKKQMISDVPLGAFLSGGIDSTTVVSIMQNLSDRPIKTFTIGFNEEGYNEAKHAKEIANYLGTDHTEMYVSPEEALDVIPKLPHLYDEPFADSSQIPTFLVSQLAKKHVTVSLSGDAGDELFGGYNRYFWVREIWGKIGWIPKSTRSLTANLITSGTPQFWNKLFNGLGFMLPNKYKVNLPGDKLYKLAEILEVPNPETMYYNLVSQVPNPSDIVLGSKEHLTVLTDKKQHAKIQDYTEQMMFLDVLSYLPDDILVKVDRASMGASLESRVPFLDHRIIEFAFSLPLDMKIYDEKSKWLLRQVLYKYVPSQLMERPKMGFGVPVGQWLRGPLREWADTLLHESKLKEEGYFNVNLVKTMWEEHKSGKRNWQSTLWTILMFEAWLEENKTNNLSGVSNF